MSEKASAFSVAGRVIGTVALVAGFLFFITSAPFLASSDDGAQDTGNGPVAATAPPSVPMDAGTLSSSLLPSAGSVGAPVDLHPSFGLFNASFANPDGGSGFKTEEHRVTGACLGAGTRYLEAECPDCQVLGNPDGRASQMLLWQEVDDGESVVRAVSRDCISVAPDGIPVVGTLEFGDDAIDLGGTEVTSYGSSIPILPGNTRVAAVKLGSWSATFDTVSRPVSALPDMANALLRAGWREVSDPQVLAQEAFLGHRVFTNQWNEVCVISLSRQDGEYKLLTIVNGQV